MQPQTLRAIIAGSLLLHGVAHAIALGALIVQSLGGNSPSRVVIQTWLDPTLQPRTPAALAIPFWIVSTLVFLAASLSLWGVLGGGDAWRRLAIVGASVSILGITLFSGIWPGSPNRQRSILNTFVALAMNLAILITQLLLDWPGGAL